MRRGGRIVSVAVIVAVSVNSDSRRKVLGMEIGTSEAEPIWTELLRKLPRRGLRGVKLVVSDAHEGLKAAVTKVLSATWQRCRVHFMRNVLAHAGKSGRRVVSAFIATAFAQETPEAASTQWRAVADQIRPKCQSSLPSSTTPSRTCSPTCLFRRSIGRSCTRRMRSTRLLCRFALFLRRAVDLVAKRGASAGSAIGQPNQSLPV
ncbi:transposase [Hoeflea sp.]|uniref:transposase n=1 Tax=Hoeflea sp. TaxID=1940281 RepID=UPI0025C31EB8|nr:transposase [Hoeflea sp.]